jgi:spermidine/putrescine transport system ATP-binding protein
MLGRLNHSGFLQVTCRVHVTFSFCLPPLVEPDGFSGAASGQGRMPYRPGDYPGSGENEGGRPMKKIIELKNVTKSFDGETVLNDISLNIYDNEFLTLLGPSGCGKTTTLRLIGGFESPDEGDIVFMGKRINDVPPHKRDVNTVFQRYALFPHLNVFENVAFPLRERRVPKDEINRRVTEMLSLVALSGFENRSVTRLSGGQQQRVAIARALINNPKVLLLDEPLGALDLKLRKDMQQELKKIQKATGITFVFVTHDQEEALSMSDTIVVMSEGRIQQIGTPIDIYNEPQNAFVADFIGESNIVDGVMLEDYRVSFSGHTFDCVDKGFDKREAVDVVVRPEDVDIVSEEKGMLRGVVTSVTFMGVHYEIIVDINGFKWMIQTTDFVDVDEHIGLYIEPDAIHIMKKSEYSGMYGDYSSFSNELDELSDAESEPEE